MALFPTTFELLLPNWNIFTILGVVLFALGILIIYLSMITSAFIEVLPFNPLKMGWFMIFLGIFFIWGISIVEDFIVSPGGKVVLMGSLAVILVSFLVLYHPKVK